MAREIIKVSSPNVSYDFCISSVGRGFNLPSSTDFPLSAFDFLGLGTRILRLITRSYLKTLQLHVFFMFYTGIKVSEFSD